MTDHVVCIAGGSESEHSFRDVTPLWPPDMRPAFHDVAGLTGAVPLAGYTWQTEVHRLAAHVDSLSSEPVYLLGFSAGATLVLSYVAAAPERVAGIGLIEPAWSFLPLGDVEQDYFDRMDRVLDLPPDRQRMAFLQLLVRSDVELPPRDPKWNRPYEQAAGAGDTPLAVGTRAMRSHRLPAGGLGAFTCPAYLAIGARSAPMWQAQSERIRSALPQCVVEAYPERHHLDAPQHTDAQHLVNALVTTWRPGGQPAAR